MAQYFTDFSEYPDGPTPSDFTVYAGSSPTVVTLEGGEKALRFPDNGGESVVQWDVPGAVADTEIYLEAVHNSGEIDDSSIQSILRTQDASSLYGRYEGQLLDTNTARMWRLRTDDRSVSNSTLGLNNVPVVGIGDIYCILFQTIGTNQKLKVFRKADGEPASWTLETSDSEYTTTLGSWIGRYRDLCEIDVLFLGAGTNGDPAPTEPVDGGGEFISELTPRTETSQVQSLAFSAGSTQSLTPLSSTAQTVNLFTVAGNSQPADLITDNAQPQLQQLISGFSVVLLPESDTSATQELGFIGGVRDDLIVALVPAADASALQDLQVRLGQLQQATPEADSSALMTLNLVAGTSVPFSAVLSPDVDSAALQAQGFVSGFNAQAEPATDTQGLVTLDDRSGQVISLDPAIESAITQTLGLFTGVVIGKFTRSSVLELSPQYSVSELSTAYDIIDQTPVYSLKEI